MNKNQKRKVRKMKKYLIIPIMLALVLVGCSQDKESQPGSSEEGINKEEIFAKFVDEKDLKSYRQKGRYEVVTKGEDGQVEREVSEGLIEAIKEPSCIHRIWKNQEATDELEDYLLGNLRFSRRNHGEWDREELKGPDDQTGEQTRFIGQTVIDAQSILKPLKDYYELTEEEDTYRVNLESNPENIDQIKKILLEKPETASFFENLSSLKAKFTFAKESYEPLSFVWEAKFDDLATREAIEIKRTGEYRDINQVEKIDLPEDLQREISK